MLKPSLARPFRPESAYRLIATRLA